MPEILVPMTGGKVMHVIDMMEGGLRYRWTRYGYIKKDGWPHFHDHIEEVPNIGPLLFIPPGPDVDGIAVRDLTQMAEGRPPKPRENKPDIQKMYQQFNERRLRELSTHTVHQGADIPHDE